MAQVETVGRTIRNQRYRAWPVVAACLLAVVSWLGMGGFVLSRGAGDHEFTLLWCIGASVLTAWALVLYLAWLNPVAHLRLAENMEVWPRARRVAPTDVVSISFAPDPAEDYLESPLPIAVCEATVRLRFGRPLRLIVSKGDAARVREWAVWKGIVVNDPEGYSTHGVRNGTS